MTAAAISAQPSLWCLEDFPGGAIIFCNQMYRNTKRQYKSEPVSPSFEVFVGLLVHHGWWRKPLTIPSFCLLSLASPEQKSTAQPYLNRGGVFRYARIGRGKYGLYKIDHSQFCFSKTCNTFFRCYLVNPSGTTCQ